MGCWLPTNNNLGRGDASPHLRFGAGVRRPFRLFVFFFVLVIAAYAGMVLYGSLSITSMLTVPLKGDVCCFDLPHQGMRFRTADGLTLFGWYVPPRNGAVVILMHTYYTDRRQVIPVARMLIDHGYGVVMYDQRASGQSDGEVRSLGWLDIPDVSQAVTWVQSQPGVDAGRIGIYGCSMGGAIALAAAAQNPAIAAVAADAPSMLTFDESRPPFDGPYWFINFPTYALYYWFVSLRAHATPSMPTWQAAQMVAPRPLLLISTDQPGEAQRVDSFYAAAGQPKSRWHIPQAGHCGGPGTQPDEYEWELTEFFDGALLKEQNP